MGSFIASVIESGEDFMHLFDVFSRRLYHWSITNDTVSNELWEKTVQLNEPFDRIFKHFVVAASIVVENLLAPKSRTTKRLINVNIKKMAVQQFRELYTSLLAYFVFIFYATNSLPKGDLQNKLISLLGNPERLRTIFLSLDKIRRVDLEAKDSYPAEGLIFDEIASIINDPALESNLSIFVPFILLLEVTYNKALRSIRNEGLLDG